jgi:hypothetical protein
MEKRLQVASTESIWEISANEPSADLLEEGAGFRGNDRGASPVTPAPRVASALAGPARSGPGPL